MANDVDRLRQLSYGQLRRLQQNLDRLGLKEALLASYIIEEFLAQLR